MVFVRSEPEVRTFTLACCVSCVIFILRLISNYIHTVMFKYRNLAVYYVFLNLYFSLIWCICFVSKLPFQNYFLSTFVDDVLLNLR